MNRKVRYDERISGYLLRDIGNYIDYRWADYSNRFKAIVAGKRTFNWQCAFFDSVWFAYRKMTLAAVISTILNCLTFILLTLALSINFRRMNMGMTDIVFYTGIFVIGYLALRICIYGRIGDKVYFRSVKRNLDSHNLKGRRSFSCAKLQHNLYREGGISIKALFGFLSLKVALIYITSVICVFLGIMIRYY